MKVNEKGKNKEEYVEKIKPLFEKAKKNYHNKSPVNFLNELLKNVLGDEVGLSVSSKGHSFFGRTLNPYIWSDISIESKRDVKHKFSPQIYIMINSMGLKYGFCYGDEIDNVYLERVKNNTFIQEMIVKGFIKENGFIFGNFHEPSKFIPHEKNQKTIDFSKDWTEDSVIIKQFPIEKIPYDIEKIVHDDLKKMMAFMKAVCFEVGLPDGLEGYNKQNFLNEAFLNSQEYDRLLSILEKKKNIILSGPPGVGKTFIAKRLAYSILGNKNDHQITQIQFHQNYSYEDFIEGYRPDGGDFALHDGIFKRVCEIARINPDNKHFLLIDEINRSNISKVFGEVMMLIEADKRGNEHHAILLYSKRLFSIPENLYLIGTMNTADRSLAMMDYALRRRFGFYEVLPAFHKESFKSYLEEFLDKKAMESILSKISLLNNRIENEPSLGRGYSIGHSYFMNGLDKSSDEGKIEIWYQEIIDFEISPLIEEYWFDDPLEANKLIEGLKKS